jgi:uncharacterized membrane protein (Fun14 family)
MSRIREWMADGVRGLGTELMGPGAPWKARSVWAAAVIAILGTGFWRSDAPKPPPAPAALEQAAAPSAAHEAGPASSAAVTLGISYIGGFFLGWCYRRFVKLSVVLTGGVLAVLALVKSLGWFESDVSALEGHVREGSAWLGHQAAALNDYLTGLLPSAGATAFGAFRGFRRRKGKSEPRPEPAPG